MSDHYRALTRTYRPRTFEDIVAQDHVSSTLRNAVNTGRLAHAYLFCGPRGVGKTTMARVLARVINDVQDEVDSEQLASTLNIFEMDAASNNGVDDVRNLRESVRVPPQTGRYKVYIIDEVHMLTKPAWNAFLKTLEEPPPHAIFIFATTEPNKLLPTILSRVQRFDFRRIRVDEIVARVRSICDREGIEVDDDALHLIAKKADGGLRDALSMMDQAIAFCGTRITYANLMLALNTIGADIMFFTTDLIAARKAPEGMAYLHDLIMQGYDLQELLVELLEHFRNLFMAKSPASEVLIEATEGMRNRYRDQAAVFGTDDILRMMHIVAEAQLKLRDAAQPRMLFELALLKLLQLPRLDSLETLILELREARAALKTGGGNAISSFQAEKPAPAIKLSEPPKARPVETAPPVPPPGPMPSRLATTESPAEPVAIPAPRMPAAPEIKTTERPVEPGLFALFDQPAIRRTEPVSASIHVLGQATTTAVDGNLALATAGAPKKISLSDVLLRWQSFGDAVEMRHGLHLAAVIRRSQPVQLEEKRLTLQCEDDFFQHTLEEHRVAIADQLKSFFGVPVSLQFTLAERAGAPAAAEDNYSQFQRLRNEDPRMRLLIDLLGAEPDF